MAQSQAAAWGGLELPDRHSVLVAEDGTQDDLVPELTAALQSQLEPTGTAGLRSFINEILLDIGVTDMDDIGGEQLSEILEGVLT